MMFNVTWQKRGPPWTRVPQSAPDHELLHKPPDWQTPATAEDSCHSTAASLRTTNHLISVNELGDFIFTLKFCRRSLSMWCDAYDVTVVNHRVIGWLGFHENHRKCSFRCDGFAHAQASGRLTGGCFVSVRISFSSHYVAIRATRRRWVL